MNFFTFFCSVLLLVTCVYADYGNRNSYLKNPREKKIPFFRPSKEWTKLLDLYISTGVAHRIMNTYCGRYLITRPEQIPEAGGGQCLNKDLEKYIKLNTVLCQCSRFGDLTVKYLVLFQLLRVHSASFPKIALDPYDVARLVYENRTQHIIVDKSKTLVHYQAMKNGALVEGFAEFKSVQNRIPNEFNLIFCEHYFFFLMRMMDNFKLKQLSFTIIDSSNSKLEKYVSDLIQGIGSFIVDETLPVHKDELTIRCRVE